MAAVEGGFEESLSTLCQFGERTKVLRAKRSEKGYGDEDENKLAKINAF